MSRLQGGLHSFQMQMERLDGARQHLQERSEQLKVALAVDIIKRVMVSFLLVRKQLASCIHSIHHERRAAWRRLINLEIYVLEYSCGKI